MIFFIFRSPLSVCTTQAIDFVDEENLQNSSVTIIQFGLSEE